MAKKTEIENASAAEVTPKKRPNYQRKMPIQFGPKRGKRLAPVLMYLFQEGISIANLADRLGLSRQGISTRFVRDNCSMKDMEEMAAAAGYKFVWSWEKVEKDED